MLLRDALKFYVLQISTEWDLAEIRQNMYLVILLEDISEARNLERN